MTLTTITHAEPWMTPQERDINQDLIGAITRYLAEASVPENPLVDLRINDIATTWILARRLESVLTPTDGAPAPCPTPAQAGAIGKCREHLRKAIKELEDYCAKNGAPARPGLLDKMHEAVRMVRATGILDQPAADVGDDYPDTNGEAQPLHHQAPPNTPHPIRNPHIPHPTRNTSPEPPINHIPAEAPPPPNRKARRRQAREERRYRRTCRLAANL